MSSACRRPAKTVRGPSFAAAPGGKGANQALAARRAGANVALVGAVGGDPQAGEALILLNGAGVDLARVKSIEGVSTGVALIMVDDAKGENMIAIVAGANGKVTPADVAHRAARAWRCDVAADGNPRRNRCCRALSRA